MDALKTLKQSQLTYQLKSFSLRQLLFLDSTPVDIYGVRNGLFEIIIKKKSSISKDMIKNMIAKKQYQIFIKNNDADLLLNAQQENLRKVTRSLSVGDSIKNCKLQMNLLTIHMEFLYQQPTDDDRLSLQFQSARNLCSFLIENIKSHKKLYQEYLKQKHHYIFAQPMISSLFVIGVAQTSRLYNKKELESLFLTSYLKDIGMSVIPTEKYSEKNLTDEEKKNFMHHPEHSISILKGRVPLSENYLNIIANHHAFSLLQKETDYLVNENSEISDYSSQIVSGTETVFINCMDILAALITGRPYQDPIKLFDALDFIRVLISDSYSQEFKVMVNYFKSFNTVR